MLKSAEPPKKAIEPFHITLNWFEELKRLAQKE